MSEAVNNYLTFRMYVEAIGLVIGIVAIGAVIWLNHK